MQGIYPVLPHTLNSSSWTLFGRYTGSSTSSLLHFYPREAMRKRGLCCRKMAVCLYVCLSVCLSHAVSVLTAKPILKLFRLSRSPIILVFEPLCRFPIRRVTPSAGTIIHRGRNFLRFSTEIVLYLGNGTRWAHGYYGTLIGSHRWRIDTWRFRWPWMTFDRDFKSRHFSKSNISKTLHLWTKLCTAPLSMTLSDLWPGSQGHDIFRHWIAQKWHEIEP